MGKEGRRLKRGSTSTDVQPTDRKPLHKAERELQNSETDVNPKKRKKKSKSKQIEEDDLEPSKKKTSQKKEMKKFMKNLQEFFLGRADIPGISMKELLLTTAPDTSSKKEEPPEKTEELTTSYECCFKTEDSDGNNRNTLMVRGLDTSLPREFLKSPLRKHFESCGCEVTRVFVPIEGKTGVSLGYAFIDVDDKEKAFELGRGYMEGCRLFVMTSDDQPESSSFPNFRGCKQCGRFISQRRQERFLSTRFDSYYD